MKRLLLLLLCVVLLICIGCTKQWSDEKGHIYRHDIEPGDFAFLFDEWAYEPGISDEELGLGFLNALRSETIDTEDIFDALGLPYSTKENFGVTDYQYMLGDEYDTITIKYIIDEGVVNLHPEIYSIEDMDDVEDLAILWSSGNRTIGREQYKMRKRFDISERELSFINENTTSKEVQRAFGAPHYYIESRETGVETTSGNAFVYAFNDGNFFKIIYFRQGYIFRAWIEDKDRKQIKLLIDRNTISFYED